MRKLIGNISIILLAACAHSDAVPVVSVKQLQENPEFFDGKMVRTTGSVLLSRSWSAIYTPAGYFCGPQIPGVEIYMISIKRSEAVKILDKISGPENSDPEVIIEGIFKNEYKRGRDYDNVVRMENDSSFTVTNDRKAGPGPLIRARLIQVRGFGPKC